MFRESTYVILCSDLSILNLWFCDGDKKKKKKIQIDLPVPACLLLFTRFHIHYSVHKMLIFPYSHALLKRFFSHLFQFSFMQFAMKTRRYKRQIHLFKFILSTDRELLTYYILNIVKIIPVTCCMSLQLFFTEK